MSTSQVGGGNKCLKRYLVRSGIRTHALRRGLRPERSALDLSAILTFSGRILLRDLVRVVRVVRVVRIQLTNQSTRTLPE